jgi:Leucine-rich repeat (LRR) protein
VSSSINQSEDLTPLRSLKNLEHLFIGNNATRDLVPLSELTTFEILALYNNDIRNLLPLQHSGDLMRYSADPPIPPTPL